MRKRNGHDWGYLVWRCWRAQSKLSSMKWSRFGSCPCWILRCKRTSSSNILKHWDKKCWDGWVLKADAVNVSCARRFNFNKKISEFKQSFWELLLFKRKRLRNDDFSACFRPLQFRLQRFSNTIFFTKFTKLPSVESAAFLLGRLCTSFLQTSIPTHNTPTMNRHTTKSEKFFINADRIENIDESTKAFSMTHLRPFVSPRKPQK